ncbi:ATV_HP_G0105990.mRNA.1.CDS.1 [Saccharomyces cerevisiae]|nr:ATV_HP_G0105990.mRNA.1.CDS.1 [Saccharomyces cerevisiae]CAI6641475.1 ATV_HP_G0105990.mRNA.1.CDS.1 [Saccharomyces cerevisiae]
MFKRQLSTSVRYLQHYDESLLSRYYPESLLKSIKLAQQTIPEDTKFRVSRNVQQPLPGEGNILPPGVSLPNDGGRKSKSADVAAGLHKQTGVDPDYITRKLTMKPLVMKRVSNQTGKGKIASFYALVVVGDKNGMVGLGEGKSREEMYHGVKLHLRSAKPGFGLRENHVIFEICECAGIKRSEWGKYTRNDMNIAKGTIEAFTKAQKTLDEVALGRGKKLVDVRKVYYSS